MDVQGSQYHLLNGRADFGRCADTTPNGGSGLTLAELWADEADGVPSSIPTTWEYDDDQGVLRLRRDTPLFRRAGRSDPLDPSSRRGAGRDSYGNWFWIDADNRTIRWLPTDDRTASVWWSVDDLGQTCTCGALGSGTFTSTCTCLPPSLVLCGLTVTTHHYLLVGYTVGRSSAVETTSDEAGLLVFDLQAGGAPLRLLWPASEPFDPWDLADTADGGALVLDRTHGCYWRLDDHLRLQGVQPTQPIGFSPTDGSAPIAISGVVVPTPLVLLDESAQPIRPISIEPGPTGSVLVLDAEPSRGYSVVYCFDADVLRWQTPLLDIVEVIDPEDPDATSFRYSILAHDFVYTEEGGPLDPPMLYVADAEGDQVVAFTVDPETGILLPRDDFLPMRRWAERGLVRTTDGVWYDFGPDEEHTRWISLQVFTECRFATTATFTTAVDWGSIDGLAGDSFDSGVPACVWHRLLLDAHVPTGTSISIRARASDDPTLLLLENWLPQPTPYQRSDGSELPWSDPWSDKRGDPRDPKPLPDGMGTHELLFQHVIGRYLQLEMTFTGGGRATPLLRSLRSWFPRFSYADHYLPAVYVENDAPDRFLERFLANFEGSYTALEEKIEHSHLILDSRTTLASDLPWLACWFGLALDPLWDEARRRFLIKHVDRFYRMRGTVGGLVATLKVYLDAVVDEGVFCGGGAGGVRVVEKFLTRDTGGAAYGAPEGSPDPDPATRVREAAHRFDVLVPVDLDDDQVQMVQRIVETAKPAHTSFTLRRYYELFVIGQARLGLDTEIGHALSFVPTIPGLAGSDRLAGGYLGYPRPFDLADRVVSDRDRVGALPAL